MRRRDLLIATLIVLGVWELGIGVKQTHPARSTRGGAGIGGGDAKDLPGHILASLWRVTASTILAILLAAPAGLVLGQSVRSTGSSLPDLPAVPHPQGCVCAHRAAALWDRRFPKILIIFLISSSKSWCWCATRRRRSARNCF